MLPFPNCPKLFLPQHFTAPPVTIAHVWAPCSEGGNNTAPWLAAIAVAPVRPVTVTGVDELVVVPFPNCPEPFDPEQLTAPPVTTAHVWPKPPAIAVTPVSALTATGLDEPVVVPSPNCPEPLDPQHLTAPPVTTAHAWPYPAATAVPVVTEPGMTGLEAADDALSPPSALTATTVNVYVVPLASPVTVCVVAVELNRIDSCATVPIHGVTT